MSKILKKNEKGEIIELSESEFLNEFEKEHDVPAYEDDDGNSMEPEQVVHSLYKLACEGKDLPEPVADYSDVYDAMREAIKESKDLDKEKKEAAKKEKEEAKAKKEKEEQEKKEKAEKLEKRRNVFLEGATSGLKEAGDSFREELTSFKSKLPKGIEIKFGDDSTFGLSIDDDVSDEDLSSTLGLLIGGQENSEFMANAHQFFIGEVANKLVDRGIYDSMIQCGKALSEKVFEELGKKLSPRNIESYARMAKRIPMEYRNPKADPTAYLAISEIPYPKKPSKKDYEDDKEGFAKAKKEHEELSEKIDKERLELAAKVKQGSVTVKDDEGNEVEVDLTSRKSVTPLVDEIKFENKLKERPDPDKKTAADHYRIIAESQIMLEHFVGIHKKGKVVVHPSNDSDVTGEFTEKELNERIEESKNALINMLYGDDFNTLIDGEKTVQVQVYEDNKETGKKEAKKDKDGNLVKKEEQRKVYPKMYSFTV